MCKDSTISVPRTVCSSGEGDHEHEEGEKQGEEVTQDEDEDEVSELREQYLKNYSSTARKLRFSHWV